MLTHKKIKIVENNYKQKKIYEAEKKNITLRLTNDAQSRNSHEKAKIDWHCLKYLIKGALQRLVFWGNDVDLGRKKIRVEKLYK